jgi:hypothetical protein
MSIASNVIDTNTKLATIRNNLKTLLENHGIIYYNTDDIFTLARRAWFLVYPTNGAQGASYSTEAVVGQVINFNVTMRGDDGSDLPDGSAADFFVSVNGGDEIHLIGKSINGEASCPFVPQNSGDVLHVRSMVNDWAGADTDIDVYAFRYEDGWEVSADDYTLVKYPSSATVNVSEVDEFNSDYDYANGIEVSKTYGAPQAGYMIPTNLIDGIDLLDTGIHFSAIVSPMYSSSSGWACGICLLNSKTLTHYRDNKILELGAYPGKKGLKYSGTDHTITEINATSGQLTINGAFKFDLWYDGSYIKATIEHYWNGTVYYSYESSSLPSAIADMDTVFPAFMIYDYGGKIRFRDTLIEPWSSD